MRDVQNYFEDLFEQYGNSPQSMGYGSTKSQEARFSVLAKIGELHHSSVLDVGCGKGDLFEFLTKQGASIDYTGWDLSPRLIQYASAQHKHARFKVCNLFESSEELSFDWVLASGIFNLELDKNEEIIEKALRRMFNLCRRGTALNLLSAYNPNPTPKPGFHFYQPEDILRLAFQLSKKVALRHDYLPHDFTLYLYR